MDLSRSESPTGPSTKRVKLDTTVEAGDNIDKEQNEELDGDHCSICLQLLLDRTVIPDCSHEFCFECIVTWAEQSRRCPLCTRAIGPYLIHRIRSNFDYQKYHLPPLRSSPPSIQPLRRVRGASLRQRTTQERRWGRRERRDRDVADELERAIDRRRWIYQNGLFAKHVGSNRTSRYRPFPTPAQFNASPDYISRATIFIRRELRVWPNLDVEFLTTFILSLMKAIDIRSESAIKLMAEFLDMDRAYREGSRFPNAEHFAHELYSFLRSPYKSLSAYDVNVQYDEPESCYRQTNRDNQIASEDRVTYEWPAPRSRARHHSCERLLSRVGSGRSRSKSNTRRSYDGLDESSIDSPENHEAMQSTSHPRDSLSPSTTPNSVSASLAAEPRTQELVDGNRDFIAPEVDPRNGKGKERETPELLATHVDHGRGSHNKSSRNEREEGVSLPSANTSVLAENCVSAAKENTDSEPSSSHQNPSQPSGVRSRIRNPLLIAQAHLLEGQFRRNLDNPRLPLTNAEGSHSDPQKTTYSADGHLSLLSRISEPQVQTNGLETELPESDPEASKFSIQTDKSTKTVNEELRPRLSRRLEAERASQAELKKIGDHSEDIPAPQCASPSTTPSGGIVGGPSAADEEHQTADHEAKARVHARVKMKLAIEKHVNASKTHSGNAITRDSEEKPGTSLNREGILRTVLENRRRGG